MTAQLKFVKLHLNKPQNIWNDVIWTEQTKVETFDLKCTATEQCSEAPEQIRNRTAEKEKKSNLTKMLWRDFKRAVR